MKTLKENVKAFDADVENNEGYLYTTNMRLSSVLSTKRSKEEVLAMLDDNVHTAIDIGTGDGAIINAILQQRPGLKITGIDPAAKAIQKAAQKYKNIEFLVGNILEPATLPAQKFDMAMFLGVLHHVSDPKQAIANATLLSECLLILEPNGNNPILKVIEKLSPYHRKHEEQSFRSSVLKAWCKDSGYVVERTAFIGFVPILFPDFLARLIYFFQPFLEKIYPLKKYLGSQIVMLCRKSI
ncbi:MAG: class I SAM-dependent methyltransferase [Prevotellaceae bacterium]|jgi:ubiquinone/menaquinone biosynthesis C-methylase UbiE|nr:class I SAM-dependent methyltransferase [Prevotellaceae bacterium]